MSLRAAIVPYMDEDGLVIERPNQSDGPETGNGIRERCVLEYLCFKRGETKPSHLQDFYTVIRSCEVGPWRGLYHRGPRKTRELSAHDDRRCLAAVSSILALPFAREIHDYGKRNHWAFDNLQPASWSFRTWDYRFPGVVPAYRLQAGHPYLPTEDVALCAAILASAWSKEPKQKIIWALTIESLKGRLLNLDSAIERWWLCLKVQYGSLGGALAAYYKNPNDPRALLSPV